MTAQLDRQGRSPLHYAAADNDLELATKLLKDGADPNLPDQLGFTPLHLAAQQWSLDVANLLLNHGAEVEAVNSYGNTPLFVAVGSSQGRGELIELLRRYGADPAHVNNAGQSPVGFARLIGNYDVARFFDDFRE